MARLRSPPTLMMTPEETIRMLQERAKQSGDRFLVKVNRRKGYAGLFEHLATFAEATVEHIANAETWLPQFCGGGEFNLRCTHMDDINTPIGGPVPLKLMGEPMQPKLTATTSSNWRGPGQLMFPLAEPPSLTMSSQPTGVPVIAHQPVPANPFAPQPPYYPSPYDDRLVAERDRLEKARAELVESKAKAEREQQQREHELKEKEREAKMRQEFDTRLREQEAKMAAAAASATKPGELITALTTALSPLLIAFMDNATKNRMEMMKMEQAAQQRQQELMAAAALAQRDQQQQMITLLTNKGIDPTVTTMMEMVRSNAEGSGQMMSRIVDAMGTVSKTSIGMIEAIADLQLGGQPESPILQAVREGVKAMASLSKGAETGARKQVAAGAPQQKKALPPNAQPPAQNGTNPAHVQVFERPNAPTPNQPPATEAPPSAPQAQAFDGAEVAEDGLGEPVEGEVLNVLEAAIRHHHDPDEVADFFVLAVKTAELQAALTKANGDPNVLIAERLGIAWVMLEENREYLTELGHAVQEAGVEAGIIEPDEAEGDDAAVASE